MRVESFVVGVCLLLLGVVWTLANLGALELIETLRTWWPLSLVIWGAAELFSTWRARSSS